MVEGKISFTQSIRLFALPLCILAYASIGISFIEYSHSVIITPKCIYAWESIIACLCVVEMDWRRINARRMAQEQTKINAW